MIDAVLDGQREDVIVLNPVDIAAALNSQREVERSRRLHDWMGGYEGPSRCGIQQLLTLKS